MHVGLVFGAFLILLGVLVIVKILVPFDLPVFKILLGLLFVYIGVSIIVRKPCCWKMPKSCANTEQTMFGQSNFQGEAVPQIHSVLFGSSTFDYSTADLNKIREVKINVAFGSAKIILPQNAPLDILGSVAFGGLRMPNGNSQNFGSLQYITPDTPSDTVRLRVQVDVAFGEAVIFQK